MIDAIRHPNGPTTRGGSGILAGALLTLEVLLGLSAVAGGIGLLASWIEMPVEHLDGTPFASYTAPGIILAVMVGGSLLASAILLARRRPLALLASLAAGAITIGWITVQFAMLGYLSWLQPAVFALGLSILALAWRLLPRPVAGPRRSPCRRRFGS